MAVLFVRLIILALVYYVSCGQPVPPVLVETNVPALTWDTQVDPSGVFAFRVQVFLASNNTLLWDSYPIWQENEPFPGFLRYEGPFLERDTVYSWVAYEFQLTTASGSNASQVWYQAGNGSFVTSDDLITPMLEAIQAVYSENMTSLFMGTMKSILGRIEPSGWMNTSINTAYNGMFVRDSSAAVFAMMELGEFPAAQLVLNFMTNAFTSANLSYAPHVISTESPLTFDMTDQPDGTFHFINAWATFVNLTQNHSMLMADYMLMKTFINHYLAPGALYVDQYNRIPYFNSTFSLLWNPNLEHSRDGHYWSCYDVLTNSFAVESLRYMIYFAYLLQDTAQASAWDATRQALLKGLSTTLTYTGNETLFQPVMAELYGHWHEFNPTQLTTDGDFIWGISWVSIGAIPAFASTFGLTQNPASMTNINLVQLASTFDTYRRFAFFHWENALFSAQVAQTNINATLHQDPSRVVIGKGLAWEMAFAAFEGDWNRVTVLHNWLAASAGNTSLYGESYYYDCLRLDQTNCWGDIGNAEQASWFLWAQAIIHRILPLRQQEN